MSSAGDRVVTHYNKPQPCRAPCRRCTASIKVAASALKVCADRQHIQIVGVGDPVGFFAIALGLHSHSETPVWTSSCFL